MIHCFSDELVYMQYLIFYESLHEGYLPAYNLWQNVLEEYDNTTFDDTSNEKGMQLPDHNSGNLKMSTQMKSTISDSASPQRV